MLPILFICDRKKQKKLVKKHIDQITKWVMAAEFEVRLASLITLLSLCKILINQKSFHQKILESYKLHIYLFIEK